MNPAGRKVPISDLRYAPALTKGQLRCLAKLKDHDSVLTEREVDLLRRIVMTHNDPDIDFEDFTVEAMIKDLSDGFWLTGKEVEPVLEEIERRPKPEAPARDPFKSECVECEEPGFWIARTSVPDHLNFRHPGRVCRWGGAYDCGQVFADEQELVKHIRDEHQPQQNTTGARTMYRCDWPACDRRASGTGHHEWTDNDDDDDDDDEDNEGDDDKDGIAALPGL
ncbi:hypothetical protein F5Y15DRAFT_413860 [Xylariaceae sp. FL0016]|nr:hypothetical protein F5Y15DRAFT_413860 [Xylariaceae sp. FL0016]